MGTFQSFHLNQKTSMGIPLFFKWIRRTFPKSVKEISVSHYTPPGLIKGPATTVYSDTEKRFDNLYLDLNSIIHNCFHGSLLNRTPMSQEDVFENIYQYYN